MIGAPLVLTGAVAGVVALLDTHGPVIERCEATLASSEQFALDPEQTDNAALMTAISLERGLPARAATIAIATAFQESKVRNIDYGDRDSLGLFQQRPSQGWGTPEQVTDPAYATNAFYDALVQVADYRDLPVTEAAQAVQRSAFPNAYADHEPLARAFASALTGYSPAALRCDLRNATGAERERAQSTFLARAQRDFVRIDATGREDGSVLLDATSLLPGAQGQEARRIAWAVAQWAVATADHTGVTRVATDGMAWERSSGAGGWLPYDDEAEPLGPGLVVVS